MSKWAEAFAALARIPDTRDTSDIGQAQQQPCVTIVSSVTPAGPPADPIPTPSVTNVSYVTSIRCSDEGTLSTPLEPDDTRDTSDTRVPIGRPAPLCVTSVPCVTPISASDPVGTIDLLAAELLSQAERNPAITITDHAKALDYFRARAAAGDAESKSTAKPPQPESPSALLKLPKVAEITRIWPGARFVQFIDE